MTPTTTRQQGRSGPWVAPARADLLLSDRELQVVTLAAQGLTDCAIQSQLGIAAGTLGTYWTRIRNKTSLESRVQIVSAITRQNYEQLLVQAYRSAAKFALATKGGSHQVFRDLAAPALVLAMPNKILFNSAAADALLDKTLGGTDFKDHVPAASWDNVTEVLAYVYADGGCKRVSFDLLASDGKLTVEWLAMRAMPGHLLLLSPALV